MKIVVTNDDGCRSAGIRLLAAALARSGNDVRVLAPENDLSGSGTLVGKLEHNVGVDLAPFEFDELSGVAAHSVAAPPALIALLAAQGALGPIPEVVVSGINHGWNVGAGVIFSGTLGAALAAASAGIPAVAISCRTGSHQEVSLAASIAAHVVRGPLPPPDSGLCLNVNVPSAVSWTGRATACRLAKSGVASFTAEMRDHQARLLVVRDHAHARGSDSEQIQRGVVTVTALNSRIDQVRPLASHARRAANWLNDSFIGLGGVLDDDNEPAGA